MRVLYNALQAGNRSGTGRYTVELLRALAGLEAGPSITAAWPAGLPRPQGTDRVDFVDLPADGAWRLLFDQSGAHRLARRLRADVVHYPASVGPLRPMPGLVLTVHDLAFLRHPEWFSPSRARYYRLAVGRSAPKAARVVADSHATARDLVELLGIPRGRIDVAHLGVGEAFRPDAAAREAVRRKYPLPDHFFLYLGTLEPRKNLARVVEAFSRVAGRVPQDLVLAGRHGWRCEALQRALEVSPCRDRIQLPGFIEDADQPALIAAADAFVWPSLYEGFGLPPLEAMACGTPVLTSNASSLPEVVGEAALTVPPEDIDAIAAGMARLAKDDALRDRLRTAGPARAAGFTWRRCAEAVLETYRKLTPG